AIARAHASGGAAWQELEALRALGIAALLAGEPEAATVSLREVWERTGEAGVADPGAFPVAPDLVAALSAAGAVAEARRVAERLAALAESQDHPWGRAAAARARGLILIAEGDAAAAAEALADARGRFEALEMRFAAARCELSLGTALRRLRRLREARDALAHAAARFDRLGSPGWAALARAETARVGGRRSAGGSLTPTEARVAELVGHGLANKQVAAELVVTVGAVEAHLTRIFAKLGVRSRTELARRLADAKAEESVGESPLPKSAGTT
ncbi:MAG: helix-turn-helix transcriptional regulator, partial [Solirubrobacteraceae bacterium]